MLARNSGAACAALMIGAAAAAGCVIPPPQGHLVPAAASAGSAPPKTPKVPARGGNPFAGAAFYVDNKPSPRHQADTWRAPRPDNAAAIERIANQPKADWIGDWNPNVELDVDRRVTA